VLLLIAEVSQAAEQPPAGESLNVSSLMVSRVTRQSVPENYIADAVIEAVNQATIAAETSGRIKEVLFDVDDVVEKGDVLIRFSDREQRASLSRANAQLKEAEARLSEAEAEQKRVKGVFAKKLVPQSAMDKANADLKAAKQRVNAARASVKQAQEQLSYTEVKAPYAGIVVKRHVEVGETARPGTPLMSGFSLEKLRATAIVPQNYVETIREIGKARVYQDQPLSGQQDIVEAEKVSVFPYADPQSHGFKVRLQLPGNSTTYYPGMWIKAAFELGSKERLLVPAQAVVHRSEVTAVYVVAENGKVSFRQVRVGGLFPNKQFDDNQREVLAGLHEGETVALDPVRAGVKLKEQRLRQKSAAEK
jgi:RND family efflux transporter MFP subunit